MNTFGRTKTEQPAGNFSGGRDSSRLAFFRARHRPSTIRSAGWLALVMAVVGRCVGWASIEGMLTPRLSPDGVWIAVSYQGAIAKVARTGGPLVILTRDEGWASDPAWSPDATRLAYVHEGGTLRLIAAESGAPIALPQDVPTSGPLWFHPDGRRVLGIFGRASAARLGWVDLATGQVKALSFGDPWTPFTLSEDGRSIFFADDQDVQGHQTGDDGSQGELFRAPADGGGPELVVRFPARIYGLSVDGRNRGLYVVTDQGTAHNDVWHLPYAATMRDARKLTSSQADDDSPSTDARGRWLVHTENSRGPTQLICRDTETDRSDVVRIERVDFGQPTGRLRLTLTDRTEREAVARVSVKRKGGNFHAPAGAMYRRNGGLMHFYVRRETEFELPAGQYEVWAFRGPEYHGYHGEFAVTAGSTAAVSVTLERWVNLAAQGWYSGENHIHANYGYGPWYNSPPHIFDQIEGEDLRVANLVVANSNGEAVFDREFFTGQPHPLSTPRTILYWNEEFRSTLWGHMTLFNLQRLVEPIFTGFRGTTNPWDVPTNWEIAARTNTQGGLASYTHPANNSEDIFRGAYAAKGLPVDIALGRIDTIDVMGAVYETSIPVWYHVLNCGFRIPAAAGTDCFLNRMQAALPGYGRVYVHLPGGLDYAQWVAGLKAGRSFVSNGPVVELTVDGRVAGETLTVDGPTRVRLKGRVESQFPLRSVEVIANGSVAASVALAPDKLSATVEQELSIERTGWVALRTSGPAPKYWSGGNRGAHTNPIYVEVHNRPADRAASAAYFLAWIDRLEQQLLQRDRMDTGKAHVLAHLEQAREVYRGMLSAR